MELYDVVVLGAGPAGLAAGLASHKHGANTLIIERENKPGGILKQCIHDGFGLIRFNEKLTGPEYAKRYIDRVKNENIPILTSTFATHIEKNGAFFILTLVNAAQGVFKIKSTSLVLASGCRERTSKQISIHGSRPSGIYTAGTAQHLVNILGYLPCKKCIVLGSGDIGLIMARRLTLEGTDVLGVFEAKPSPSGLSRNIAQCLEDFSIPLYLSRTITRVFGEDRVEGVEACSVDEKMNPIPNTETRLDCDGVILSVGLIPENEIAESLGVQIDKTTGGPYVDQNFMTTFDGVFSCGNALHVSDLVDYVSESGECAGESAALFSREAKARHLVPIKPQYENFLYLVPQYIDMNSSDKKVIIYFRSRLIEKNVQVQIKHKGNVLFSKKYMVLKPPEMERIAFVLSGTDENKIEPIEVVMLRR